MVSNIYADADINISYAYDIYMLTQNDDSEGILWDIIVSDNRRVLLLGNMTEWFFLTYKLWKIRFVPTITFFKMGPKCELKNFCNVFKEIRVKKYLQAKRLNRFSSNFYRMCSNMSLRTTLFLGTIGLKGKGGLLTPIWKK